MTTSLLLSLILTIYKIPDYEPKNITPIVRISEPAKTSDTSVSDFLHNEVLLQEQKTPKKVDEGILKTPQPIQSIIQEEGKNARLSQAEINRFINIAKCESTFNPKATNGSCKGLFQIHSRVWSKYINGDLYDPHYNAWFAFNVVYSRQGWSAWTCKGY